MSLREVFRNSPAIGIGIAAVVFFCGQCDDPDQRSIIYLSTTHPDHDTVKLVAEYKAGEPPTWHPFNSEEGLYITSDLIEPMASKCPQGLDHCLP